MRLALTGEFITAPQAERHGLVTEITAPGQALEGARALAAAIAANAPLAVAATKGILDAQADWTSAEAFDRQQEFLRPVFTSADAREGATAFAEKRAPVWRGE
jgi:enoyl-CoA hydratase